MHNQAIKTVHGERPYPADVGRMVDHDTSGEHGQPALRDQQLAPVSDAKARPWHEKAWTGMEQAGYSEHHELQQG